MFGHKSDPTIVYRFGCRAPTEGLAEVNAQIELSRTYYNALVAVELKRREAARRVFRAADPRIEALDAACEAAEAASAALVSRVASEAAAARGRVATPDDRKALAAARKTAREARAARRAVIDALADAPAVVAGLAAAEAEARAAVKALRTASGLYWGNYAAVEQAFGRATHRSVPPRAKQWSADGKVAVQLQKGLAVPAALAGADTRLRVVLPPGLTTGRADVWFRVGSAERAKPVWARVVANVHRPIPADAVIKWAYLVRARVATRDRWSAHLVLSRAAGWAKPTATTGRVGVDLGWRAVPGGLRVAAWVGSDGAAGELVLPAKYVRKWEDADGLRAVRDRLFGGAQQVVAAWAGGGPPPAVLAERAAWYAAEAARELAFNKRRKLIAARHAAAAAHLRLEAGWPPPPMPPALRAAVSGEDGRVTVATWRSVGRLAALVLRWRDDRFPGDAAVFDVLEAWRKQDKHLFEWEANLRRAAVDWRTTQYYEFAKKLALAYREVVVEDADWRALQTRPGPEAADAREVGRHLFRVAAVGALRRTLVGRFAAAEEKAAAHTTADCAGCGVRNTFDRKQLTHRCVGCGEEWDQDYNAARNLLTATPPPGP